MQNSQINRFKLNDRKQPWTILSYKEDTIAKVVKHQIPTMFNIAWQISKNSIASANLRFPRAES